MRFRLIFIMLLIFSARCFAQTYTWTNASGDGLWSTGANWSSPFPGTPPTTASDVVINSGICTINTAVSVGSISIGGGTLTQSNGFTVQTSGDFTITSGTFNGGNSNIRVTGSFSQSGGTFISTSADLQVRGSAFAYTGGTFTPNGGSVRLQPGFAGTTAMTVTGNPGFNNLRFDGGSGGVLTLANSLDVTNNFTIAGVAGANATLNLGGNNINVNGDMSFGTSGVTVGNIQINNGNINLQGSSSDLFIYNTGTGTSGGSDGGSATINFTGTGTSEINSAVASGGVLPNVSISKPSGTLNMAGTISLSGNWTQTSGTVAPQSSTVDFVNLNFNAQQTISVSSMSFNNIKIDGSNSGTVSLGSNLDINGNLTIGAGSTLNTSASSFDISVAGSWTESATGTFVPNLSLVTFDGSTSQSINVHTSFYDAMINTSASGSVTLASNVTVTNNLHLASGIVNTSSPSQILNIADDATVTGGSALSYVDGPMTKTGDDAFTFPVGDAGYFHPISISQPQAITDVFTAQYFATGQTFGTPTDVTINTMSNCEYWDLKRTTGNSDVFVTFGWDSSQCPLYYITDVNDIVVAVWDSGTGTWQNLLNGGTTGDGSAGTVTTFSQSGIYGPFTIGSTKASSPLPIELFLFTASVHGNYAEIEWATASETNNDFFTVQRADNLLDFKDVGHVSSKNGNSNTVQEYSYIDKFPLSGTSYYRLAQTDYDGSVSYSKVVAIDFSSNGSFSVFPNPYKNGPLSIVLPTEADGNVSLSIFDVCGKSIFTDYLIGSTSKNCVIYDFPTEIDPGVYVTILYMNGRKYITRFSKVR